MLADDVDYVIGVDTHRDEHVLAVVSAPAGAVVAGAAAPTNARGYCELLRVAERYASGRRAWAIEGSGSYGAGLARFLACRGEAVLEVSRTPRMERRLRGKDDALDAARTARAVLASETLARPRAGEQREALRLLLVARRSAVDVRREALTQLRAVIVTAPERLRQELRELTLGKLLQRCSRLRRTSSIASSTGWSVRSATGTPMPNEIRRVISRITASTPPSASRSSRVSSVWAALLPQPMS